MSKRSAARYPLFRLAAKNIKTYAWINAKLCFVFACLTFLICLFTGYNSSLDNKKEEMLENISSSNYVLYFSSANKPLAQEYYDKKDAYFPECKSSTFKSFQLANLIFNVTKNKIQTPIARYFDFIYENEKLTPSDSAFRINAYSADFPFTENDCAEMDKRFQTPILTGKLPENEKEIALSEDFLKNYGLNAEAIGSEIKIGVINDKAPLFEGKIVGVINSGYYSLAGHKRTGQLRPMLLIWEGSEIFKKNTTTVAFIEVNEILTENFSTEITSEGFIYAGKAIISAATTLDNVLILANTLYIIIGSALVVGLILTVLLMIGKYIKIFSRACGIFMTFGMPRNKINGLLIRQLTILALFSVPVAFVLTALGYFIISKIMLTVTGVVMEISIFKLLAMLAAGIAVIAVISFIMFLILSLHVRKKTVKELLVINI